MNATPLAARATGTCSKGTPPLDERECGELLGHLPRWSLRREDGMPILERIFKFRNFAAALDFTNRIGALAEAADHHPALLTEWGKVTVRWWTHSIGGLHMNDFIMAARCDESYDSLQPAS